MSLAKVTFIKSVKVRRYGLCCCVAACCHTTATISLYSVKRLVSITETECVYCTVRAGSLNVILVIFPL